MTYRRREHQNEFFFVKLGKILICWECAVEPIYTRKIMWHHRMMPLGHKICCPDTLCHSTSFLHTYICKHLMLYCLYLRGKYFIHKMLEIPVYTLQRLSRFVVYTPNNFSLINDRIPSLSIQRKRLVCSLFWGINKYNLITFYSAKNTQVSTCIRA